MTNEKTDTAMVPVVNQTQDIMALDDATFNRLDKAAHLMASGKSTLPAHLQNSPGDCMAIIMQAAAWKMNPFLVAQKTHVINGNLGYEAQLVNAVVTASGVLRDRPRYEHIGDWSKILGKMEWTKKDEEGLGVRVIATMKDSGEERVHECYLVSAKVRNSPLWKSQPQMQLEYLAIKQWVRRHAPDVLLGVYTTDELPARAEVIEVSSEPIGSSRTENLANMLVDDDESNEEITVDPEVVEEPKAKPGPPNKITKTQLMKALAKTGVPDALTKSYCVDSKALKEDQDLQDLPENWKQRIVASPESFRKAIDVWTADSEEA